MEEFNLIQLHRARDFGKKINATFEFFKQNFKPLSKSILLIAGPAVLIASVLMGSFFSDIMSMVPKAQTDRDATLKYFGSATYWSQIGFLYLFLILASVITIAVINSYIELYYKKQTNKIATSEIWEGARQLIWKYLGSFLLMILCAAGLIIVVTVVGIVLGKMSTVVTALAVIAAVVGFLYLAVGISLVFFIQAHEGSGFFEAAARSLKLISGKWWSTFGLAFVLTLIAGVISYIFMIPFYVIMVTQMMHSIKTGGAPEVSSMGTVGYILFTLFYMAQMLLQSLPQVGLAFQYFNLVELKEAKGLMDDIDNFGKTAPPEKRDESF